MKYNRYKLELGEVDRELDILKEELIEKIEELWEETLKDEEFLKIVEIPSNQKVELDTFHNDFVIDEYQRTENRISFNVVEKDASYYSSYKKKLLSVKLEDGKITLEGDTEIKNVLKIYKFSKMGIEFIKKEAEQRFEDEISKKQRLIKEIEEVDEEKIEETETQTLKIKTTTEIFTYKLPRKDIVSFMNGLDEPYMFVTLPEKDKEIVLNKKDILRVECLSLIK